MRNGEEVSCILEVDLEYPKELHSLHTEYPLAPEQMVIEKTEKLIPHLGNWEKYVLHIENLKQYLQLGLKLTRVYRRIKFVQSKPKSTAIPNSAPVRNQDFFKLMNNSVFGKTMKNIRKRVDIRLISKPNTAKKLLAKPNYECTTIFDKNLIAVHTKRIKLVFNKPVYLSMCILDLSKTLMYDFSLQLEIRIKG